MNILLTGGLGYIGSHVTVVLSEAGHQVTILDNLCNKRRSGDIASCIADATKAKALLVGVPLET